MILVCDIFVYSTLSQKVSSKLVHVRVVKVKERIYVFLCGNIDELEIC